VGSSSLIHTPDVAKERVSPSTSFMDGSYERVATSTFVANSYQRMQVFAFGSSNERPPVSLRQLFEKHITAQHNPTPNNDNFNNKFAPMKFLIVKPFLDAARIYNAT